MYSVIRTHEICVAHRLVGHAGGCQRIHGHNYVFEIECRCVALNEMGMVVDFTDIKNLVCKWLYDNWDHRTLLWSEDPIAQYVEEHRFTTPLELMNSIVVVPYNPTVENMGYSLVNEIFPELLNGEGAIFTIPSITIYETSKCKAVVRRWTSV